MKKETSVSMLLSGLICLVIAVIQLINLKSKLFVFKEFNLGLNGVYFEITAYLFLTALALWSVMYQSKKLIVSKGAE